MASRYGPEPPEERRQPSVLEQRLQVIRNERGLSVAHDDSSTDPLAAWRPHAEAAAETHRTERHGRRGKSGRKGRAWLWLLALVLICAAVAAGVALSINGRIDMPGLN